MTNITMPSQRSLSLQTYPFTKCDAWIRARHSHDAAIVSEQGTLTYLELVKLVESRALKFQKAKLEKCIVALQRKKSAAYVIDLVALLSIGAVVMPIDPSLPRKRRTDMLTISQASASIAEDGDITIHSVSAPELSESRLKEAAYIFFTSGSTGHPKAILGSARSLRNFIQWQGAEFEINSSDRIPFITTIGFDVSLRDILLPLHHGATLLIPEAETEEKPQALLAWMRESDVTRLHAVPSLVRVWSQCNCEPMTNLHTVFSAGEKLTSQTLSAIKEITHPNVEIVNLYGPTETTLAKFFHKLNLDSVIKEFSAPVGTPLPGTSYHLGTNGEIIISTPDASLGYLGASVNDNARFNIENGITTYHTGDIGELDENGLLHVVGRLDDQVKINGVRLHLKEVEHVLSLAPMVNEVVVLALPIDAGEDLRLAAIWTGAEEADNSPRAYALDRLPRPVVPTIWERWNKLPINSNGKTDRSAIANALTRKEKQNLSKENYNPTEKWLCKTLEALLSTSSVQISDDFFALGGTSLHVAFLIGKVEKAFNKALAFSDVFENSKLVAIALAIDHAPENIKLQIPKVEAKDTYDLSPQQRRWWNIYMPFGNRSWATMVRMIGFEHKVTGQALRKALFDLTLGQISMQLSLHSDRDEIFQKRTPPDKPEQIPLSEYDFSEMSAEGAKTKLDDLRLDCANSEIAIDSWPLFRCLLVQMPNDKSVLIFTMHHMISDGFSMGLIETALRASLTGNVEKETKQSFNYLDYAAWAKNQEPVRFGENSDAELYWRSVFAKPYRKHIFKEKWTGKDGDRGQGYCCEVPHSLRLNIQNFARKEHVTDFSVYFAAKFRAWHKLLNRNDLVIGTPAAGRDIAGTDTLIGNFISLCCIRSRLDAVLSDPADYVRTIMQAVASGMTHQGYQYDTLVRSLGMEFKQDRFPLTTLFISYLNFEAMRQTPLNRAELGFSDLGFAVKFDVMSYVREHKDCASFHNQPFRKNSFDEIARGPPYHGSYQCR